MNLSAELDYFLLLKVLLNEQLFAGIEETYGFVKDFPISQGRVIRALNRLVRRHFLSTTTVSSPEASQSAYVPDSELYVLGLPYDFPDLKRADPEEIRRIIYSKMKDVERDIEWERKKKDTLEEIVRIKDEIRTASLKNEEIKGEIEVMKDKIEKSQIEILRNMIGIFAIFVSIFSFILIGAGGALSIRPETVEEFRNIIIVISLPILVLLLVTYFLFIGRKSWDDIQRIKEIIGI